MIWLRAPVSSIERILLDWIDSHSSSFLATVDSNLQRKD